jgi:hypothetical protein
MVALGFWGWPIPSDGISPRTASFHQDLISTRAEFRCDKTSPRAQGNLTRSVDLVAISAPGSGSSHTHFFSAGPLHRARRKLIALRRRRRTRDHPRSKKNQKINKRVEVVMESGHDARKNQRITKRIRGSDRMASRPDSFLPCSFLILFFDSF